MSVVTIHQAKTNLSRLIEKASEGEEVQRVLFRQKIKLNWLAAFFRNVRLTREGGRHTVLRRNAFEIGNFGLPVSPVYIVGQANHQDGNPVLDKAKPCLIQLITPSRPLLKAQSWTGLRRSLGMSGVRRSP